MERMRGYALGSEDEPHAEKTARYVAAVRLSPHSKPV
jgi:hypothetical protein